MIPILESYKHLLILYLVCGIVRGYLIERFRVNSKEFKLHEPIELSSLGELRVTVGSRFRVLRDSVSENRRLQGLREKPPWELTDIVRAKIGNMTHLTGPRSLEIVQPEVTLVSVLEPADVRASE